MSAKGKKILMVIAPEGFRDEEFFHPKEVLETAGAVITVASKGVKVAQGKMGGSSEVDIDIDEAKSEDYDAISFSGGPGSKTYFKDEQALKLAREFNAAGKVTAAICIAPTILVNAGILEEKKATSYPGVEDIITARCKEFTGEDVTVDGNIVTGNGPESAKKYGEAIRDLL